MRRSDLVERVFTLKGKPFSFKKREMFRLIYDKPQRSSVYMMGRQMGKSTTLANEILIDALLIPWSNTLFVTPREKQTRTFSTDKLMPVIKYSPVFKALMMDSDSVSNVFDKSFANNSKCFLRYAYLSADSIRGISAHKVILDEVQDIIWDNVGIIDEVLSGSEPELRRRSYAGTPKTFNNTLNKLYQKSTKHEFIIKCQHCNKWNILGIENVGRTGVVCKKCSGILGPPFHGEWVATNSDPAAQRLFGVRLPQLLSPNVDWEEMLDKYNTYPTYQFHNEVLALPFDVGANPLSELDLRNACTQEANALPHTGAQNTGVLAMGVDWGHGEDSMGAAKGFLPTGYTVATLGRLMANGTYKIIWMKKYVGRESDPRKQVQEVAKLAKIHKVNIVGVDHGAGFYHNAELKDLVGETPMIEFNASGNVKEKMKWDPEVDDSKITFHRTRCMSEFIHEIKGQKVLFPKWDDFKPFCDDFTTVYIDFSRVGTMYYDHVLPDDAFHASMIGKMASVFYASYMRGG
ncbi:MAG: Phage terminase large subunit (GpA) [Parcubacteria group bacterium ADurb.Bin192]|nr:MAG: Phage terminase large subunit (GpA) [Parcubacteria group bacterium ADurb.Bin192]